jgi:hypothetical protein
MTEEGGSVLERTVTRISGVYSFLFIKKELEIRTNQSYHDYINRQMLPKTNLTANL